MVRIVDADEGGRGWVVRRGRGLPALGLPTNRQAAIAAATIAVLAGGGGTVQVYTRSGELLDQRTVGESSVAPEVPPPARPAQASPEPVPPAAPSQAAAAPAPAQPAGGESGEKTENYPAGVVFGAAAFASLWAWFGRPEQAIVQLLNDQGISDETKDQMLFVAMYALPATAAACISFLYLTRDKETSGMNKTAVVLALFLGAGVACRVLGLGYPVEFTLNPSMHGNLIVFGLQYVGMAYINAYGFLTLVAALLLGTWAAMAMENKWGKFFS